MKEKQLTGGHVALIFCSAFSIIVAVNLTLAFSAVSTFPGLEVKNSYVASQFFDANRAAQEALEWDVRADVEDDLLTLRIDGPNGPVAPEITRATLGRATHVGDDRDLVFFFDGDAHKAVTGEMAPGNWNLRLAATAEDGTQFQQRIVLWVSFR
ncbi:MAG: FixH family protein [Pseudomonadota bacterium]